MPREKSFKKSDSQKIHRVRKRVFSFTQTVERPEGQRPLVSFTFVGHVKTRGTSTEDFGLL